MTTEEKFLFFDIECMSFKDGKGKIFSFGYFLTDDKFNIIEKNDLVINPNIPSFEYDSYVVYSISAYSIKTIKNQPTFDSFYKKISELMNEPHTKIFGFDVGLDMKYVNQECERYNLAKITKEFYDVQAIFCKMSGNEDKIKLKKLITVLNVDVSHLREHNSRDDAEMTMLCFKEICKLTGASGKELTEIPIDKLTIYQNKLGVEKNQNSFSDEFKKIRKQYPQSAKWKKVCLSETLESCSNKRRLEFIKLLLDNGYDYTTQVNKCDVFVVGAKEGDRDSNYDFYTNFYKKKIEKVSVNNFLETLNSPMRVKPYYKQTKNN